MHLAGDQVTPRPEPLAHEAPRERGAVCKPGVLFAHVKAPAANRVRQQRPVQPERGPGRRQQASSGASQILSVPLDEERVESQRLSGSVTRSGDLGFCLQLKYCSGWSQKLTLTGLFQGLGLFAARDMEKQTMVIEYNGTILRKEVAVMKEKIYRSQVKPPVACLFFPLRPVY